MRLAAEVRRSLVSKTVAEIRNEHLAHLALIVAEGDAPVDHLGGLIDAMGDIELHGSPSRAWEVGHFAEQAGRAAAQGHKGDAHLIEAVEIGVGGEPRIEDQFAGKTAVTLLPELHETQNRVGLIAA